MHSPKVPRPAPHSVSQREALAMIADLSTARRRDRAGTPLNCGSGAVLWGRGEEPRKRAGLDVTPVRPRSSGSEDFTPRPRRTALSRKGQYPCAL
jgi:hypothetical protein